MGLPKKIALTGIGIVAGILAISFLAKKTNILSTITKGLSSTGSAVGQGIGGAFGGLISGVPIGFGQQAAGTWQQAISDFYKWIGGQPQGEQSGAGLIPEAYGSSGGSSAAEQTVNPSNREQSDVAPSQVVQVLKSAQNKQPINLISAVPKYSAPNIYSKTPQGITITTPNKTTSVSYNQQSGSYVGITKAGGAAASFKVAPTKTNEVIVTLGSKRYSVAPGRGAIAL